VKKRMKEISSRVKERVKKRVSQVPHPHEVVGVVVAATGVVEKMNQLAILTNRERVADMVIEAKTLR
jgi:hypothetical protein